MDRVDDWFGDFYTKHTNRCPREDWPVGGTDQEADFLGGWKHQFVTRGVEKRWADLASLNMAGDPPKFLDEHLPTLIKLAIEYRLRDDSGANSDPMGSLDAAKLASKDCPDCLGTGGAVRYVHESIHGNVRTFGGGIAPVGMGVTYPCSCPMGRMMARGLRQEGQARDPLHVGEYPSLRMGRVRWSDAPDNQYRYRPSQWDDDAGMPVDSGEVLTRDAALAALKRLTTALDASRGLQPPAGAERARGRLLRDLDAAAGDPVIDAEVSRPEPPPRPPVEAIPEDAEAGWF